MSYLQVFPTLVASGSTIFVVTTDRYQAVNWEQLLQLWLFSVDISLLHA